MPRPVSLNFRAVADAQATDVVPIVLVTITHPDLEAPLRLSTDPTVRTSSDPLTYGTWHQGQLYEFVVLTALLPDDIEDSPARTSLSFENVDVDLVSVLRAVRRPATMELRMVLSNALDTVEDRYTDLLLTHIQGDADKLTADISREYLGAHNWPYGRMTAGRFAGLHR